MILHGKTHKFGDHVNTDDIIPAIYLVTTDHKELAKHAMEGIDPGFLKKIAAGDIVVAGKNFGCGSSREHAPVALKAAGISAVIAESFARIFFRNSINIGLPILELPEANKINAGDELELDLDNGKIKNITQKKEYSAQPFPEFMQEIISAGGLINKIKKEK